MVRRSLSLRGCGMYFRNATGMIFARCCRCLCTMPQEAAGRSRFEGLSGYHLSPVRHLVHRTALRSGAGGTNYSHGTSLYEEQMFIQAGQAGDMFRHWRAGSLVRSTLCWSARGCRSISKKRCSVAHFDRKPLVVENQGLQGHSTFFSLEKARLGRTWPCSGEQTRSFPTSTTIQKKVTWPPQWFMDQPFWRYFRHYAAYVNRAQFMNGQGVHVAPVAIYYPLETAFANSSQLFNAKPHRICSGTASPIRPRTSTPHCGSNLRVRAGIITFSTPST